jgi:uncharacterized protein YdeI (YjbR/CyaY-like superfamily)
MLCAPVFQRRLVKRSQAYSDSTNGECAGGAHQIRFTNVREIMKMKPILKAYIREAIAAEKAGLAVSYKKTSEFKTPAEFKRNWMKFLP